MQSLDMVEAFELRHHCFAKVTRGSRAVMQFEFSWGVFPTREKAWKYAEELGLGEYLSAKKLVAMRKANKPAYGYSVRPVQLAQSHLGPWILERRARWEKLPTKFHRPAAMRIIMLDKKTAARLPDPRRR